MQGSRRGQENQVCLEIGWYGGGGVPGRVPRDKVEMLSRGQGSGSCALGVGFSRGGSLRPRTLLSRPGSRTSALA